jgi:hypothetical protein
MAALNDVAFWTSLSAKEEWSCKPWRDDELQTNTLNKKSFPCGFGFTKARK